MPLVFNNPEDLVIQDVKLMDEDDLLLDSWLFRIDNNLYLFNKIT